MKMILAADEKWGIGRDGGLLCHLPSDLAYFKEKTLGKTVIMGRVTLESLPGGKGLPGRTNIVLTRNPEYSVPGVDTACSDNELWSALTGIPQEDVFVIGGEQIYRKLLPLCDEVFVTKIMADLGADRFFPDLDADPDFEAEPVSEEMEENGYRFRFYVYRRVN
ncbi:MAG: dihydrofolate reductase [Firmicutes bacterium]|nr:dihydrofolate reductase [Eubacterium sp.]MBR3053074.1 dihydrofolate reductase [Bacillota bacterium]MBR3211771.1 dihydrofolate reductase [Bacillota bacterium]MCR4668962.1 dihydrofolate reductase [Clostridia bacterium]MCR4669136.1 dihydrofolate reductase [Clostridia bacterium]